LNIENGNANLKGLRSRAEKMVSNAYVNETYDCLSPEQVRQKIHELRVHQEELQMQNDQLREAQKELEVARKRYFDLYDLAPVGYLTLNREGMIQEVNLTAAQILGREKDELLDEPLHQFIAKEDQDTHYLNQKQLDKTESQKVYEIKMVKKDGSYFWVQVEMTRAQDWQSRECTYRTVILDITQRKQAEETLAAANEELREADRRKNEFLGILSHELRNPLATIMMALSQLDIFEPKDEQDKKAKEIINRQVSQLYRLVEDLLAVSRITQNKIVLQKKQIELNQLVRHTIEEYETIFREKGVELTFQPVSESVYVEADPDRLAQVVGNFLHNAVKFNESGGYSEVSITKDSHRQEVVICFEDNGIGIPPEVMHHLFEAFTQGDWSSSDLGLGLSIVKGLIELHGGSVSAHSDGHGKGSIFKVHLPLNT